MIPIFSVIVVILILWLLLSSGDRAVKEQLAQRKEAEKEAEKVEEQKREDERVEAERIAVTKIKIDLFKKRLDTLFDQLKLQFNEVIAEEILKELGEADIQTAYQIGKVFYENSLALIVTHNASVQTKLFALNVGRWYYSKTSVWQNVSKNDEATIQNDINIRS